MAGDYNGGSQNSIESLSEFENTDERTGQFDRWLTELNAAQTAARKWQKAGVLTVDKYTNEKASDQFKTNIFHSNINTLKSLMFGKLPEVEFSRTNLDFNDDAARVAGMMLERMLQADIGTPTDLYSQALRMNLEDRLLPGLGVSRVRYEFDKEEQPVAPVIDQQTGQEIQPARTEEIITNERAPIDYVFWRDFAWSPARNWSEVRWVAFKTLMTTEQLVERFGEALGDDIPLDAALHSSENSDSHERGSPSQDAWKRAEIWEIWSKTDKKIFWFCKNHPTILDVKDDLLKLTGFFPCPEPMVANITTTAFMPIPDYKIGQDLYLEIDKLESRISLITEAVKVVGVYDQAAEGVKRLMSEGVENDLIPVDNWGMFAEKGGLAGTIDWLPIEEIASVLSKLVERRNDAKAMLYEINGISDIMRGAQAAGGAVSATERALEARFASVRIQALQDEFAKYATDLIRLRAEVVSIHFQPQSIVEQSNIMVTADAQLAEPAVKLIKDRKSMIWRIEVKPESVAMVDYAQLKDERSAYITALATFLQSAAPLVQQAPEAAPILLEMLKWGLAGFKGSAQVEGVLDQAIALMQQSSEGGDENKEPSPEQMKQEMEQAKQQFEMQKLQMTQAFEKEKWQYEMQMAQQMTQTRQQEIQLESQAKLMHEQAQAQLNIQEDQQETEEVILREEAKHELDVELERERAALRPQPKAD